MQSFFRPINLLQFTAFLFLVFILGYSLYSGAENLGCNWQWFWVPRYLLQGEGDSLSFGPLLKGLGVTLQTAFCSLALSFVVGLLTALLRLSNSVMGQVVVNAYLELIRNTPLLVQIFVVCFVLAPVYSLFPGGSET